MSKLEVGQFSFESYTNGPDGQGISIRLVHPRSGLEPQMAHVQVKPPGYFRLDMQSLPWTQLVGYLMGFNISRHTRGANDMMSGYGFGCYGDQFEDEYYGYAIGPTWGDYSTASERIRVLDALDPSLHAQVFDKGDRRIFVTRSISKNSGEQYENMISLPRDFRQLVGQIDSRTDLVDAVGLSVSASGLLFVHHPEWF